MVKSAMSPKAKAKKSGVPEEKLKLFDALIAIRFRRLSGRGRIMLMRR